MGRMGYPPEVRRRVLDLVAAGRRVADVARDLGISDQTVYGWRRQDRIDHGLEAGLTSAEHAELLAARRRIRELETELAIHRRTAELLKGTTAQKEVRDSRSDGPGGPAGATRLSRPRSLRVGLLRPALPRVVAALHPPRVAHRHDRAGPCGPRHTYGARRVRADLRLGHGITVGHQAVELLMRRAGIQGISGRPRYRRAPGVATASDRVERQFHRDRPDELWGTDITEHRTREGKVYCAVVLDVWSRRVIAGLSTRAPAQPW